MVKKITINTLIIFLFSLMLHYFYHSLPCFISSIISPVNESFIEHIKLIYSSYILFLVVKVLFQKKPEKDILSTYTIFPIFNIFIFSLIYLPIKSLFKVNTLVTLIIYFITIFISNYYMIIYKNNRKIKNKYFLFSIIFMYILFSLFTYYPLKNKLFLDEKTNTYGIFNSKIKLGIF